VRPRLICLGTVSGLFFLIEPQILVITPQLTILDVRVQTGDETWVTLRYKTEPARFLPRHEEATFESCAK
jgi:hypothetical protein